MHDDPSAQSTALLEEEQSPSVSPCIDDEKGALPQSATPEGDSELQHRPIPIGQRRDILLGAVWFALVTGLLEGGYWCIEKYCLGNLSFLNPGFYWMAPVTYLVIFGVAGLVLAWLAGHTRHPSMLTFSLTLMTLLSVFSLLNLYPKIHFLAQFLLAGGVATTLGSFYDRRRKTLTPWMRKTACCLMLAVAGLAIYQQTSEHFQEQRAMASLPPATAGNPNVLFLVLDTVRADALGAYGAEGNPTPALDKLARKGVLFEQAVSTASWTLPATAGMLTGQPPHELSTDWLHGLTEKHATLAESLRDRGYATAGFAANVRYCTREVGIGRGFVHYEDFPYSPGDFLNCTALGRRLIFSLLSPRLGFTDMPARKSAADINAGFLDWLDQRDERPYFAFLNYIDAHSPYVAPEPFRQHVPRTAAEREVFRFWWYAKKDNVTPEDKKLARGGYDDCIRYLDQQLGRLFDELERKGQLENTIVVVTADHGEHFGDHGIYLHGNSLYQALVHVPLLIVWPEQIPHDRSIAAPVSLANLPRTIVDLVDDEEANPFPGRSLSAWWNVAEDSATPQPQPLFSAISGPLPLPPCHGRSPAAGGSMSSVRFGDHKLILNGDGREELYNITSDPGELHDLSAKPKFRETRDRLREMLEKTKTQEIRENG